MIEWIRKPIEEIQDLAGILNRADLVIDAMGFTRHHEGMENIPFDARLNYLNHLVLIDALGRCPKPVVYLGSRGQYGKLSGCITEASPQVPVDTQGVHKLAAESMFRIFSEKNGFPCISMRIGNCFGTRQMHSGKDIGLVGQLARGMWEGRTVELYGDARRSRHLIFIDDLVHQSLSLIPSMQSGFAAINIVGQAVLIKEILDTFKALGASGTYAFAPFPPEVARLDPGEAVILQEALIERAGEVAYTPISIALEKTINYFRQKWTP